MILKNSPKKNENFCCSKGNRIMSEIIKKNLSRYRIIEKKEIKSEELVNLYIDKINKAKT